MAISKIVQDSINGGVAGSGPAFRVYLGSNQNITNSTYTKLQLNTESFDTANCFDNTTNYRFTPTVAGYYHISLKIATDYSSAYGNNWFAHIYKNGTSVNQNGQYSAAVNYGPMIEVTDLVYLNGSTDYIEGYVWTSGGTSVYLDGGSQTYTVMHGYLARTA
jgi:hypothetical protein